MSFYHYINQLNDFLQVWKLHISVWGKRDNEEKILISFHEHDFLAYMTTEGNLTFIKVKWLMEKAETKWKVLF